MERLLLANLISPRSASLSYVRYIDDFQGMPYTSLWTDTIIAGRPGDKLYVVQTSPKVIERCLLMSTDPGDLVIDPTCGSGTTAFVAEKWGRRWITIDTSRVALALTRQRIMGSRFPYFLLNDDQGDVRKGFLYKILPRVSLKSIATNPDIKRGMTKAAIEAAIARHSDSE